MLSYRPFREYIKEHHISSYNLRDKDKYGGLCIDGKTYQKLMADESINTDSLDKLCKMLNCTLYDLLEYVPDKDDSAGKD
jgi:DNA-binding Xre family transcriptional regulator